MDLKVRNELIRSLVEEKQKGVDYSTLRGKLREQNIEDEEIKKIIIHVDHEFLRLEVNKAKKQRAMEMKVIGALVFAAGLVLTLGTYLGFINLGKVRVLAYGPILGGLGIFVGGIIKNK